jgi:serine/threonine-protein kinase
VDTLERLRGRLAERYQVERELGQGGMATVFLARDVRHQRMVAIKVLHPEIALSLGTERFEREILLAAQLQHPHILGLIDSGESDGLLYYVMPFVEGESLRDRLVREGPLPIDDAIQIALEVADALGYAHSHGVIHRDIKPENILLSGGHALVADFGIARAATEAGQKLTQTGMSLGTPTYMSPEQATGDPVGPTADLYSLGCVLFEMLAGEPPFSAKSAPALMARHALEAVPSIRIVRDTVPEEVEDAIFASMAKVPADRPKDAAHFAEMLGLPLGATSSRRAAIRQTASRRVPTGTRRAIPLEAPWWRRPWVLAGAAVILAGVGVAAWLGNRGGSTAYLTAEDRARARRIAVLYFAHPSGEADLAPVADALTESLIRSLRDAKLEVTSQNGVARYRGTDTPRDSIARALQIGTLIEGSVVPEGSDRVRVTTWLTDSEGNELGRRTNVLIPRDSLFAAEAAVSHQVSVRLREQLGLELRQAEDRARAGNAQAWTLYQRAQTTRKEGERAAVSDRAEGLQRLAIANSLLVAAASGDRSWVEPLIARGEVALSRARLVSERTDRMRWIDSGLVFAGRAVETDPTSAAALALRGGLRFAKYRLTDPTDPAARSELLRNAEADLQNAVTADGTLAAAYATLSSIQYEKKDVHAALTMARNAYEADAYLANADNILASLSDAAYDTEQFAESDKWCAEGARRFPGDYRFTMCQLWGMITPDAVPNPDQAWRLARRVDSVAPAASRALLAHMARMIVGGATGKRRAGSENPLGDSARRVLVRARGDADVDPEHELPGYEAIMRAQIGDLDSAIVLLRQYVAYHPDHSFEVGGNVHWWWRELKAKPEFQALLARKH